MKKKLTEIFGMGDQSDGVPKRLPPGGLPVKKPTMPFDRDGATSRMTRNADNDVTSRFAKGSGPTLGSPQDEPLPDLPLEGEFDDLNRSLNGAQSVVRGNPSAAATRRGKSYTNDTAKMQADVDSARSVSVREAFGMGAGDIKNQLSSAKDTYAAISKAIKMAGTGRDPVEVASALHDALYGEGSKPQPIKGGSEMGSSSSSMTSKAVGGLKLQ